MKINLFPIKEYVLKSHFTMAQIIDVLSANVMEPIETNTGGLLPEIIDERKGIRRYFEGIVNDHNFTINYKSYYELTPSSGGIISFIPRINGNITETEYGVEVKVVFEMYSSKFIPLLFTLPLIFILPGFVIVYITSSENLISISIKFLVLYLVTFIYSIAIYRYRIQQDIAELRTILKVSKQ